MEKELDELSSIEDDKINSIKLIAFNDKKDMNCDIFKIIYNHLINQKNSKRFASYLENIDNDNTIAIAQIISI
jgi:lysyl-tRNA synthetase class I